MATTERALVTRWRDVVTELGYREAVGPDFALVPVGQQDGAFFVRYTADPPVGRMGFGEEARGRLQISVMRPINNDYQEARLVATGDGRSIVNALVRDGAEVSGEYTVEDTGRVMEIIEPKGANYLEMRVQVAVNFEATL